LLSTTAPLPQETPVAVPASDKHTTPSHAPKPTSLTRQADVRASSAPTRPTFVASNVAMSFAFDVLSKSLNVVMTDATSGQVICKFSYKSLPADCTEAKN
jgi:hypothetical protein